MVKFICLRSKSLLKLEKLFSKVTVCFIVHETYIFLTFHDIIPLKTALILLIWYCLISKQPSVKAVLVSDSNYWLMHKQWHFCMVYFALMSAKCNINISGYTFLWSDIQAYASWQHSQKHSFMPGGMMIAFHPSFSPVPENRVAFNSSAVK